MEGFILLNKFNSFLVLARILFLPNYLKDQWKDKVFSNYKISSEDSNMNKFLVDLIKSLFLRNQMPLEITEIGCLDGRRIAVLRRYFRKNKIVYTGIDVNLSAIEFGKTKYKELSNFNLLYIDLIEFIENKKFDLVFTWAVLMYVHPLRINAVLQKLIAQSNTLILIEATTNNLHSTWLPKKNRSFTHNYEGIINSLIKNKFDISYHSFNMSPKLWRPKYGIPKVHIVKKLFL
jgi:SAM-dependent methyltransferase